ncbi:MAG: prepilin-type N-terminal cleavage/methylation domain-containing protein [Caldimonas sp.]
MSRRSIFVTMPSQRGVSLLESLVALVVLGASAVAAADMERHLRLGADIARERSEAVRLASEDLEQMRSFAVVEAASAAHSYAAIGAGELVVDAAAGPSAHAARRIVRQVDDIAAGGAKATSVAVRWSDRAGSPHDVVLHSFIAGAAPRYAGALGLDAGAIDASPRAFGGRAPGVPLPARPLGHGRSAWKPVEDGTTALVFDDASGDIVGRCDDVAAATRTRDLSSAMLGACATGRWLLVSGTIRFTSARPPLPSQANEPPPATSATLALDPHTAYPAQPQCFSEARKTVRHIDGTGLHIVDVPIDASPASIDLARWDDTGERFLAWHCVVAPRADGQWSGRASLVADGWAIGTAAAAHRVCRYVGGGAIDANIAHPADWRDVDGALVAQNFLVIRSSESCPADGTVQHQP